MNINRQTVNKLKRISRQTVWFLAISTIVSGIGSVLNYKNKLFPSACNDDWVPYNNNCYMMLNKKLTIYGAHRVCLYHNAKIPILNIKNMKVLYITFNGKTFWTNVLKKNNNWIDINNNKSVYSTDLLDITKNYEKINDICIVYNSKGLEGIECNIVNEVICSKKFYR
ncbi:EV envelope glycoprotein [Brazilian porcupinepox virus 1]|nr:EV envelope glycoprotein [Brazilian porcupinepox virus 1]